MNLTGNIVINLYSIIILIIISIHSLKQYDKISMQNKLFMVMLQITVFMLFIDIFSRFDGNPGTVYSIINYSSNFLIFLFSPLLPSFWLLFVHNFLFQDKEKLRRLLYLLYSFMAVYAIVFVSAQSFGGFYYIDAENVYHRGPLFLLSASIAVGFLLVVFVLIVKNRKKLEKKHYYSLLFFAVPPFVAIFLQIAFYGISLMLNGVVLSMLILFLNVQNQNTYTDYLTGIYNRNKFDIYLKTKISRSSEGKTFSAIMIDLNDFKSINDIFGHHVGDDALRISVKLLQSCLGPKDFIARYGGDEFYLILGSSDPLYLEKKVGEINHCVEVYNRSIEQPYKLGFSMGYAMYDPSSHLSADGFQKQIDKLMYENKWENKAAFGNYLGER